MDLRKYAQVPCPINKIRLNVRHKSITETELCSRMKTINRIVMTVNPACIDKYEEYEFLVNIRREWLIFKMSNTLIS